MRAKKSPGEPQTPRKKLRGRRSGYVVLRTVELSRVARPTVDSCRFHDVVEQSVRLECPLMFTGLCDGANVPSNSDRGRRYTGRRLVRCTRAANPYYGIGV